MCFQFLCRSPSSKLMDLDVFGIPGTLSLMLVTTTHQTRPVEVSANRFNQLACLCGSRAQIQHENMIIWNSLNILQNVSWLSYFAHIKYWKILYKRDSKILFRFKGFQTSLTCSMVKAHEYDEFVAIIIPLILQMSQKIFTMGLVPHSSRKESGSTE